MTDNNKNQLSRRDALKILGAAAGATVLAKLPQNWNSPELLSGVLPAHAQTSNCGGYMQAIAITTTRVPSEVGNEFGDFDFVLCTPNGDFIWGGNSGDGATSSPDNTSFIPPVDSETLEILSGTAGTYTIYLVNSSEGDLEMSIQITTAAGVHTTSFTLSADRAVADITFPCGEVTWRSEEMWPPCAGAAGDNPAADTIYSKSKGK